MSLRTPYQHGTSLTRPVWYCPGTGLHTLCRSRRAVDPAQAPRRGALCCGRILSAPTVWVGKLLPFSERLCLVRFRADSIRPYNCGGRAADGSTCSSPPIVGMCTQPAASLNPGMRAAGSRPYSVNRRIKIAHSRRRRGSQRSRQIAPRGGYSGFWKYLLPQNTR